MSYSRILQAEKALIIFYGIFSLLLLFIMIPLISLVFSFNFSTLLKIFKTPILLHELKSALITTFYAALISVLILLIVGIPVGYMLARYNFRLKPVIEAIIDIPFVIPHPIVGIMLLAAFGSRGLIPLSIEDTFWGIVSVMVFVSAPLMIDTIKLGFLSISPEIEYVARSLGASFTYTFFRISLPLCSRNIVAGCILSLARSLSEVGALLVLAYFPQTVNVLILDWLNTFGISYAVAVSCLYLLIILIMFIVLRIVSRSYAPY